LKEKATSVKPDQVYTFYAPGSMVMGAYANKPYNTYAVPDPRNGSFYLNKVSGTSHGLSTSHWSFGLLFTSKTYSNSRRLPGLVN